MSGDQEPPQPARPDRETAHLDWPNTVDAAREATFQRLRALVLENDPVPADEIASARASFALRSIDDELASLVYDSLSDDDLFAGVRSGTRAVRQLSFEAGELVLEMEVTGARYLIGQVVPPQVAVIELRHRGGTTNVETDELGCFHFRAVPEGPVSFRCCPARPAAPPVATSWITL